MKRFTETTKWNDPWFMDLPVKYKTFWSYICDQCDCAGFWEPNFRLALTHIGEPLEPAEVLRVFAGRIVQLGDGKFWIKGFIEFQYGTLSPDCKQHQNVLNRLKAMKLEPTLWIPFAKGIQRVQEKEKEKDKRGEYERGSASENGEQPKMTKYGLPLPPRCTIRQSDGAVLDYTGRIMDINQVRKARLLVPIKI
jgi:hypothetical protein